VKRFPEAATAPFVGAQSFAFYLAVQSLFSANGTGDTSSDLSTTEKFALHFLFFSEKMLLRLSVTRLETFFRV
jgi:hypothetical protein